MSSHRSKDSLIFSNASTVNFTGTSNSKMYSSSLTTVQDDAVGTWYTISSSTTNSWYSICWSPKLSLFVNVALNGVSYRVRTSTNGITWITQTSPTTFGIRSVCWSQELSLFVAVSDTATSNNRVVTSSDGITWITRTPAANNAWISVCWSPDLYLFVAVSSSGSGNRVMTSSDGTTWITRASAANNSWTSVCWSKGLSLLVAVAYSGNLVMTSSDSITWVTRVAGADNQWQSICWSQELGIFVAVSNNGTGNRVMTSSDGITWISRTSAEDISWNSICWSSELGIFVVVSADAVTNKIMTSVDGINWLSRTSPSVNFWISVCWSPELSIFVSSSAGSTGNIMTSKKLVNLTDSMVTTWITQTTPSIDMYPYSICWSPQLGLFVAIGGYGTVNYVLTSSNGASWFTNISPSNDPWFSVCWSDTLGLFAAVSYGGPYVMTSYNGTTWITRTQPVSLKNWTCITWSGTIFLVVGNESSVMRSSDGVSWSTNSAPTGNWRSVCWSQELSLFVAVGIGNIMVSSDGISWTSMFQSRNYSSVCWSPQLGLFVAISGNGGTDRAITSQNGINWYTRSSLSLSICYSVVWSPQLGIFLAVSNDVPSGIFSYDGINWTSFSHPSSEWYSICWSPQLNIFAAVSSTSNISNGVMTSTGPSNTFARSIVSASPQVTDLTITGKSFATTGNYKNTLTTRNRLSLSGEHIYINGVEMSTSIQLYRTATFSGATVTAFPFDSIGRKIDPGNVFNIIGIGGSPPTTGVVQVTKAGLYMISAVFGTSTAIGSGADAGVTMKILRTDTTASTTYGIITSYTNQVVNTTSSSFYGSIQGLGFINANECIAIYISTSASLTFSVGSSGSILYICRVMGT